MADRPTLSYTSTSEISTPSYTWRLKKVPLLGGASRTGHNIESTLPWGTKYELLCQKRRAVLVVFKIDQSLIGTQENCKKMQRQSV